MDDTFPSFLISVATVRFTAVMLLRRQALRITIQTRCCMAIAADLHTTTHNNKPRKQ